MVLGSVLALMWFWFYPHSGDGTCLCKYDNPQYTIGTKYSCARPAVYVCKAEGTIISCREPSHSARDGKALLLICQTIHKRFACMVGLMMRKVQSLVAGNRRTAHVMGKPYHYLKLTLQHTT